MPAPAVGESLQWPQLQGSRDPLRLGDPSGLLPLTYRPWEEKVLLPPNTSGSERVGWGWCILRGGVVLHRH